ncbi:MAG: hypothetical protein CMQ29_16480 [Gammaproteobacteria bacterium]|nr:hypothetical protein [Gammaproteobacteria bacterium]
MEGIWEPAKLVACVLGTDHLVFLTLIRKKLNRYERRETSDYRMVDMPAPEGIIASEENAARLRSAVVELPVQ